MRKVPDHNHHRRDRLRQKHPSSAVFDGRRLGQWWTNDCGHGAKESRCCYGTFKESSRKMRSLAGHESRGRETGHSGTRCRLYCPIWRRFGQWDEAKSGFRYNLLENSMKNYFLVQDVILQICHVLQTYRTDRDLQPCRAWKVSKMLFSARKKRKEAVKLFVRRIENVSCVLFD